MNRRALFSLLAVAPLGVVATAASASKADDRIMVNPWSSGGVLEPQMVRVEDIDRAELIACEGKPYWINVHLKTDKVVVQTELAQNQDIMKVWRQLNAAGVTCVACY